MASSPVLLFLFATILLAATSAHAQNNYMSPPPDVAPAPVACVPAPEPVASAPTPVASAPTPEPVAPATAPVASGPAPVALTPAPEPVAPGPAPVASAPAPAPVASPPAPVASPPAPVASPPAPVASPPAPVASPPGPPAPVASPPAPVSSPPAGGSGQCPLNDIAQFRVCLSVGIGSGGTAVGDLCCRRIRGKPVVNAVTCLCSTFLQFNVGVNIVVANKVNDILEICGITRVSNLVCR